MFKLHETTAAWGPRLEVGGKPDGNSVKARHVVPRPAEHSLELHNHPGRPNGQVSEPHAHQRRPQPLHPSVRLFARQEEGVGSGPGHAAPAGQVADCAQQR